ncbi:MAG: hypothetical protein DDT22_01265 [candidate division WS2 bacterium]|nr:hypothetical protein [Candidatus Lithacetigena glycinireducens]
MTEIKSFFLPKAADENFLYVQIRDDSRRHKSKTQIESLWKKYKGHESRNFLRETQVNFYQRWWEMFLTVGLLNLSFDIKTERADKGPDIKVTLPNNEIIWIEAVAPNLGTGKDALPPLKFGVSDLPEREFLLRLTTSLSSKADVFKDYAEKGLINNKRDACIIALSSCGLSQYDSLMDFPVPAPLKVLVGCGNLVLTRNGSSASQRKHLKKSTDVEVDSCFFNDEAHAHIAAVLYSNEEPLNCSDNPESSFQLFLNPNAQNPIQKADFNSIETWYQEKKSEDEIIWGKA